jgi:hypothetical protein
MTKDEAVLLFNINPFYTEEELKERWHFLVKHHHPDLGHNQEFFKRLLDAHQTLKKHRENYSAKQEWFDYVSRENQRAMQQVIIQERQNALEVMYMYPIIFIACPVLVGMPIIANNYRYLQQLYSLQLKISVVSNELMYVLQR